MTVWFLPLYRQTVQNQAFLPDYPEQAQKARQLSWHFLCYTSVIICSQKVVVVSLVDYLKCTFRISIPETGRDFCPVFVQKCEI